MTTPAEEWTDEEKSKFLNDIFHPGEAKLAAENERLQAQMRERSPAQLHAHVVSNGLPARDCAGGKGETGVKRHHYIACPFCGASVAATVKKGVMSRHRFLRIRRLRKNWNARIGDRVLCEGSGHTYEEASRILRMRSDA